MSRNLQLRVLTALVGVPLILFLLLGWGLNGVALLGFGVSLGMLYEFCRMIFRLKDARQKTLLALSMAALFHAFNFVLPAGLSLAFLGTAPVLVFFPVFLFFLPALFNYAGKEVLETEAGTDLLRAHVQELMALCFAMMYCVSLPMFLMAIRELSNGQYWLLLTLAVVWASDTFAYFAGLRFGKRRLFDLVSPKKTWEGAVGGVLGAILVAGVVSRFFLPRESTIFVVLAAFLLSVSAVIGDLAESLIKRAFQCKDSGSILPGHGGFLDRFDGVVFALPVMYSLLRIFAY